MDWLVRVRTASAGFLLSRNEVTLAPDGRRSDGRVLSAQAMAELREALEELHARGAFAKGAGVPLEPSGSCTAPSSAWQVTVRRADGLWTATRAQTLPPPQEAPDAAEAALRRVVNALIRE